MLAENWAAVRSPAPVGDVLAQFGVTGVRTDGESPCSLALTGAWSPWPLPVDGTWDQVHRYWSTALLACVAVCRWAAVPVRHLADPGGHLPVLAARPDPGAVG